MKLRLPRRRIWRVAIYLVSILFVLAAADMVLVQMRRTIHPGFWTTRLVAPVREDGSVDYLLAVDELFGAGVTSENNAAIPILQAIGRQGIPKYVQPDAFTSTLGMPPLAEKGDYFLLYADYCKLHGIPPTEWADPTQPIHWPLKFDDSTTRWVNDSTAPLALFSEASKRSRFRIPFYAGYRPETMIEIALPHLYVMRDAIRALQARALMRLSAGDVAGFREDLLTIHRVVRLIGQQPTLIERSVALAIETIACETGRIGAMSGKLSAADAREIATQLAGLGDLPPLADAMDKGERFFALDTLQVLARRGPIGAGRLLNAVQSAADWNYRPPAIFLFVPIQYEATMRSVNHYEDAALAIARKTTYAERISAVELLGRETGAKDPASLTLIDLCGTDWPIKLFSPVHSKLLGREESARVQSRLTRIVLMLAAFHADHGAYPTSLAELSPAYFQTVPLDSFVEKPFIYTRAATGYTLNSVGPNMKDDGGASQAPGDDIVVTIP